MNDCNCKLELECMHLQFQFVDLRACQHGLYLRGCVSTFQEAACHFETFEGETCCACVTRRLVATGGGKQADLYSFDHPGGRGRAGVSAGRLGGGGGGKRRGRMESIPG